MSAISNCCSACATTTTVNIPGSEGAAGTTGVDGVNAYTHVTADFVVPAIGATVVVQLESSVWLVIGQILIIGVGYDGVGNGPAHFEVSALPDATSATLEFLGSVGDIAEGETIDAGSTVSPSA